MASGDEPQSRDLGQAQSEVESFLARDEIGGDEEDLTLGLGFHLPPGLLQGGPENHLGEIGLFQGEAGGGIEAECFGQPFVDDSRQPEGDLPPGVGRIGANHRSPGLQVIVSARASGGASSHCQERVRGAAVSLAQGSRFLEKGLDRIDPAEGRGEEMTGVDGEEIEGLDEDPEIEAQAIGPSLVAEVPGREAEGILDPADSPRPGEAKSSAQLFLEPLDNLFRFHGPKVYPLPRFSTGAVD